MTLIVILALFIWAGGITFSLFKASDAVQDEAEYGRVSWRRQVVARGGACLAAGLGLSSLSIVADITSDFHNVWAFMLLAWLACTVPLLLPTGRAPVLGLRVSHITLVCVSIGLTAAFGLAIAAYHLTRLIQSNPELVQRWSARETVSSR